MSFNDRLHERDKPSRGKSIFGSIGTLAVVMLLSYALFGTRISTAPDQAGLWVKGGVFQAKKIDHCVDPSTKELVGGLMDKTYEYPAGQRTYKFDAGTADIPAIKSLSDDNVELTLTGVIRFTLDTSCKRLKKFHQNIGIKFAAWMDDDNTSDGWREMLSTYLQPSLKRAMNVATAEVTWKDLYDKNDVRSAWEARVSELLPKYVKQSMGDDYFSNFQITAQKPELPAPLVDALQATQVAVEQNNAQLKRNATVQTELDSIRDLVKVLGPNGYNTYKAIQDGKITVYPIPEGSSVIVK